MQRAQTALVPSIAITTGVGSEAERTCCTSSFEHALSDGSASSSCRLAALLCSGPRSRFAFAFAFACTPGRSGSRQSSPVIATSVLRLSVNSTSLGLCVSLSTFISHAALSSASCLSYFEIIADISRRCAPCAAASLRCNSSRQVASHAWASALAGPSPHRTGEYENALHITNSSSRAICGQQAYVCKLT
jgi:hypothetical protein